MQQMREQINKMKATPSTGVDELSLKTLKNLQPTIDAALLNIVNTTIGTAKYPTALKTAKVIPLLKEGKTPTDPLSYRGVNILPSVGKIIDSVINKQIIQHLETNQLFLQHHHGCIKGRSTITAILTMIDSWTKDLEQGLHSASIILDQSAAYDLICHRTLLRKMETLGFDQHAVAYFTSYLEERYQLVQVDSYQSEPLNIGPLSVCQGSVLSGLLYLMYTLDFPVFLHEKVHSIQEEDNCMKPSTTTFVDDSIVKINITQDHTKNNREIQDTINEVKKYMNSNYLILNKQKTKILVVTDNYRNKR